MVTIEFTNAYTNGESRFEELFVPRDALFTIGGVLRPKVQRLANMRALLTEKPFNDLGGEEL